MDKVILIMTLCLIGQATLVPLSAENQLRTEGPPVKNSDNTADVDTQDDKYDVPANPSPSQAKEPVREDTGVDEEGLKQRPQEGEQTGDAAASEQLPERHEGQDGQLDDNHYQVPEKEIPDDSPDARDNDPVEGAQGIPGDQESVEYEHDDPLRMRPTAEHEDKDEVKEVKQDQQEHVDERQDDDKQAPANEDGNRYDDNQDEYHSNEEVKPAQGHNQEPQLQEDQKYLGDRLMEPEIEGRDVYMQQNEQRNTEPTPPVQEETKYNEEDIPRTERELAPEQEVKYQEDSQYQQEPEYQKEDTHAQQDTQQYEDQKDGTQNKDDDTQYQDDNKQYQDDNRQYQEENAQYQDDERQYQEENTQYQDDNTQHQDDSRQHEEENTQYQDNTQHQEDSRQYQEDNRQYKEDDRQYQEDDRQYKEDDRQYQEDDRQYKEDDRQYQEDNTQYKEDNTQYQEDNTQYQRQEDTEQQVDNTQEYHTESSQGQEDFKAEESNQYQEENREEQPAENVQYHEDPQQQQQQEPQEDYQQFDEEPELQEQEVQAEEAPSQHMEQEEPVIQHVNREETPLPANPNIVIFLADGISREIFVEGESLLPNLMRIAEEGVYFSDHMAGGVTDTSSRAALMTGRLAVRYGMALDGEPDVIATLASQSGLPPTETTFASVLQEKGYTTALIGKWNLGMSCEALGDLCHHPNNHGFDHYFGMPLVNHYTHVNNTPKDDLLMKPLIITAVAILLALVLRKLLGTVAVLIMAVSVLGVFGWTWFCIKNPHIWSNAVMRNGAVVEQPADMERMGERMVKEGVRFLRTAKADNKPFLLVVSALSPTATQGPHDQRSRMHELDQSVGEVLRAVQELGLDSNTVTYFTSTPHVPSDNQDDTIQAVSQPMVPALLSWPSVLPAGLVVRASTSHFDVMPTLVEAAGGKLQGGKVYDGRSLLPRLRGGLDMPPPLFVYCGAAPHVIKQTKDGKVYVAHLFPPQWSHDAAAPYCKPQPAPASSRADAEQHDALTIYELNAGVDGENERIPSSHPVHHMLLRTFTTLLEQHRYQLEEPVDNQFSWYKQSWHAYLQPKCAATQEFTCTDSDNTLDQPDF